MESLTSVMNEYEEKIKWFANQQKKIKLEIEFRENRINEINKHNEVSKKYKQKMVLVEQKHIEKLTFLLNMTRKSKLPYVRKLMSLKLGKLKIPID